MAPTQQYTLEELRDISQVKEGDLVSSFVNDPMAGAPSAGRVIKTFPHSFAYSLDNGFEGFIKGHEIGSLVVFRNNPNEQKLLAGTTMYQYLSTPQAKSPKSP